MYYRGVGSEWLPSRLQNGLHLQAKLSHLLDILCHTAQVSLPPGTFTLTFVQGMYILNDGTV
jgi:hypothetical protein